MWKQGSNDQQQGGVRSDRCGKRSCGLFWMRLRTASTQWNVPGKYGPHGEPFFFLLKKEPRVLSELVRCGPSISTETVEACALIGLHMMAEENAWRSESGSSVSSSGSCEGNVGNEALCVIGLHGSGDNISLILQDWEVAKVALSCQKALETVCQELYEVERRRACRLSDKPL